MIGRGLARFWNLLAPWEELMADPELMSRMMAVMADPDAYPVPDPEGPTRAELLDALATMSTEPTSRNSEPTGARA